MCLNEFYPSMDTQFSLYARCVSVAVHSLGDVFVSSLLSGTGTPLLPAVGGTEACKRKKNNEIS